MLEQSKEKVPNNPVEIALMVDCHNKDTQAIHAEVFKEMSSYMTFGLRQKNKIEFKVTLLNTEVLGDQTDKLIEMFRPLINQRLSCIGFNLVTGTDLQTDMVSIGIF